MVLRHFSWCNPLSPTESLTLQDIQNSPQSGGIPIVTPWPEYTRYQLQALARITVQSVEAEIKALGQLAQTSRASESKDTLQLSQLVFKRLVEKQNFLSHHLSFLQTVTKPLLEASSPEVSTRLAPDQQRGFLFDASLHQSLFRYFPSLIRDWSTEYERENVAMYEALQTLLEATARIDSAAPLKVLVLGSGGSRLAYDFAIHHPQCQVLAADLSPLMLMAAKRIVAGETFTAIDFPRTPHPDGPQGREVQLRRPSSAFSSAAPNSPAASSTVANLDFALIEAHALPFRSGSIDLVITPWLIDIVNHPFTQLASELARVLCTGGHWLNLGSLRMHQSDERLNHSGAEVLAIANHFGFETRSLNAAAAAPKVPYLNSPLDAHERTERLFTFAVRKNSDSQSGQTGQSDTNHQKTIHGLPDWAISKLPRWIQSEKEPVALSPTLQSDAVALSIQAFTLSLVDGKRPLSEIAAQVAQAFGIPQSEALHATRHFLTRYHQAGIKTRI